jgi:hypothetical protein
MLSKYTGAILGLLFLYVGVAQAHDISVIRRSLDNGAVACLKAQATCIKERYLKEAVLTAPECCPRGICKPEGTPCSCDDPRKPETCTGTCDKGGNCIGKTH